jgi:radical SAM protein with 4Fe4S-binding SPASM domain
MTNLIVSRRCNQSCSYCFAGDPPARDGLQAQDYLSVEEFEQRLDYLDRSGIQQARFLGGEPTLHPRFAELVQRARARGKTIVVFSNGWMPEMALAALEALSPEECGVILNLTTTGVDGQSPAGLKRRKAVMRRLGQRAQPGCNIYRTDQDLDFISELINECGLKRAVRVGLAQPVLAGSNEFLPTKDYATAGDRLARYAYRAAGEGIRVELDCGFVRCMFSEEALSDLLELGADLDWRCNPIIDIDVDGRAFHCFPLSSRYWTDLEPGQTAADLRDAFAEQVEPYRQAGIYKECSSCAYKINQTCSGGCLANIMRRFKTQPFGIIAARSHS